MDNPYYFSIPERTRPELTGTLLVQELLASPLTAAQREARFLEEFLSGNVPDFLRSPTCLPISREGCSAKVWVLDDYLCLGTNEDFLRVPLLPSTACIIARGWNASLPTRFLVDRIWRGAKVVVTPQPWGPPYDHVFMCATERFVEHNARIELQRAGRWGLIAGHKKDVVLSPLLWRYPKNVAIYGWHRLSGEPIQLLNVKDHSSTYADYSHGIRLVSTFVEVNGKVSRFQDILKDPERCHALSDEGPSSYLSYPLQ